MSVSVLLDMVKKGPVRIILCVVVCGLITAACPSGPAPISGVSLEKTEVIIIVGDSETLVAVGKGIRWDSDNTNVASVDNNGKVTAKTPGVAIITATVGDKTAECTVYASLIKMAQINGGTFLMGDANTKAPKDEQPQHEVTISGFYMGIYPVTQAQYRLVIGEEPSQFEGDNLPVEQVSWYEALIFCNKLSMLESLSPVYQIAGSTDPADWGEAPTKADAKWNAVQMIEGANGYRLPTEAQWEYACRAGTTTPFHTGNQLSAENQANYDGRNRNNPESLGAYRDKTISVDAFPPNAWGLYDMHGNVWEWCWDWHALYTAGSSTDPQGADIGAYRIARGGSWRNQLSFLRSSSRGNSIPAFKNAYDTNSIGFRLVRF